MEDFEDVFARTFGKVKQAKEVKDGFFAVRRNFGQQNSQQNEPIHFCVTYVVNIIIQTHKLLKEGKCTQLSMRLLLTERKCCAADQ